MPLETRELELSIGDGPPLKRLHEQIVSRIGEKGYLELVALFLTLGFENVNDVPDFLWESAVRMYEEEMFRKAA